MFSSCSITMLSYLCMLQVSCLYVLQLFLFAAVILLVCGSYPSCVLQLSSLCVTIIITVCCCYHVCVCHNFLTCVSYSCLTSVCCNYPVCYSYPSCVLELFLLYVSQLYPALCVLQLSCYGVGSTVGQR